MHRPARVAVPLASLLTPGLAAQESIPIDGLRACARDLTDPDLVELRFQDVEVWRTAVADAPEEDVAKVAVLALTALRARRTRASAALSLLIDAALRAIE